MFKGKEKKYLQETIASLEKSLAREKEKISAKRPEINGLNKKAEDAARLVKEYDSKLAKIKRKETLEQIFSYDVVPFGSYEQGKGVQPIEWRVLDRGAKGILMITQHAINCAEYHKELDNITWKRVT